MYPVIRNKVSVPSSHQKSISGDCIQIRENSREWCDIIDILQTNIKNRNWDQCDWKIKQIELITNPDLDINFSSKINELQLIVDSDKKNNQDLLNANCVFTKEERADIDEMRVVGVHCKSKENTCGYFADMNKGYHTFLYIDSMLDWCTYKQFNGVIQILMYRAIFGRRCYIDFNDSEEIKPSPEYDSYFINENTKFNCKSEQYYPSICYLFDNKAIERSSKLVRHLVPFAVINFERSKQEFNLYNFFDKRLQLCNIDFIKNNKKNSISYVKEYFYSSVPKIDIKDSNNNNKNSKNNNNNNTKNKSTTTKTNSNQPVFFIRLDESCVSKRNEWRTESNNKRIFDHIYQRKLSKTNILGARLDNNFKNSLILPKINDINNCKSIESSDPLISAHSVNSKTNLSLSTQQQQSTYFINRRVELDKLKEFCGINLAANAHRHLVNMKITIDVLKKYKAIGYCHKINNEVFKNKLSDRFAMFSQKHLPQSSIHYEQELSDKYQLNKTLPFNNSINLNRNSSSSSSTTNLNNNNTDVNNNDNQTASRHTTITTTTTASTSASTTQMVQPQPQQQPQSTISASNSTNDLDSADFLFDKELFNSLYNDIRQKGELALLGIPDIDANFESTMLPTPTPTNTNIPSTTSLTSIADNYNNECNSMYSSFIDNPITNQQDQQQQQHQTSISNNNNPENNTTTNSTNHKSQFTNKPPVIIPLEMTSNDHQQSKDPRYNHILEKFCKKLERIIIEINKLTHITNNNNELNSDIYTNSMKEINEFCDNCENYIKKCKTTIEISNIIELIKVIECNIDIIDSKNYNNTSLMISNYSAINCETIKCECISNLMSYNKYMNELKLYLYRNIDCYFNEILLKNKNIQRLFNVNSIDLTSPLLASLNVNELLRLRSFEVLNNTCDAYKTRINTLNLIDGNAIQDILRDLDNVVEGIGVSNVENNENVNNNNNDLMNSTSSTEEGEIQDEASNFENSVCKNNDDYFVIDMNLSIISNEEISITENSTTINNNNENNDQNTCKNDKDNNNDNDNSNMTSPNNEDISIQTEKCDEDDCLITHENKLNDTTNNLLTVNTDLRMATDELFSLFPDSDDSTDTESETSQLEKRASSIIDSLHNNIAVNDETNKDTDDCNTNKNAESNENNNNNNNNKNDLEENDSDREAIISDSEKVLKTLTIPKSKSLLEEHTNNNEANENEINKNNKRKSRSKSRKECKNKSENSTSHSSESATTSGDSKSDKPNNINKNRTKRSRSKSPSSSRPSRKRGKKSRSRHRHSSTSSTSSTSSNISSTSSRSSSSSSSSSSSDTSKSRRSKSKNRKRNRSNSYDDDAKRNSKKHRRTSSSSEERERKNRRNTNNNNNSSYQHRSLSRNNNETSRRSGSRNDYKRSYSESNRERRDGYNDRSNRSPSRSRSGSNISYNRNRSRDENRSSYYREERRRSYSRDGSHRSHSRSSNASTSSRASQKSSVSNSKEQQKRDDNRHRNESSSPPPSSSSSTSTSTLKAKRQVSSSLLKSTLLNQQHNSKNKHEDNEPQKQQTSSNNGSTDLILPSTMPPNTINVEATNHNTQNQHVVQECSSNINMYSQNETCLNGSYSNCHINSNYYLYEASRAPSITRPYELQQQLSISQYRPPYPQQQLQQQQNFMFSNALNNRFIFSPSASSSSLSLVQPPAFINPNENYYSYRPYNRIIHRFNRYTSSNNNKVVEVVKTNETPTTETATNETESPVLITSSKTEIIRKAQSITTDTSNADNLTNINNTNNENKD